MSKESKTTTLRRLISRKVRLPEPQEEWERPLILDAKDNIERMARNEGKRAKLKGGIEEMLAVVNKRSSDQLFGSLGRFDAIPPANNGNGNGNKPKENGHEPPIMRKVTSKQTTQMRLWIRVFAGLGQTTPPPTPAPRPRRGPEPDRPGARLTSRPDFRGREATLVQTRCRRKGA